MEHFLEARRVVKRYAAHTALGGVSLGVRSGRIFGLLGPNGAGKTTLIRIINRITMPDEGEVLFDGHPIREEDVLRIGYLPEERGLYKKMKVGEQAVYLARLKGLDKATAVERLTEWFEKFEIMPWWNKKLEELSKGMQQKVQFVTTVLHRPDLLILDEPFSGFDPVNAELLKREILALKDAGHTIIFSTHNMNSVEEVCDDIALIDHSRVVLQGSVADVRSDYRTGLYEVTATPDRMLAAVDGLFEIQTIDRRGDSVRYVLRKADGVPNSGLLTALAQRVDVRSFVEKMPSMNEIFLRVVGENKGKEAGHGQ